MKKENSFIIPVLSFVVGFGACYIATQYSFFNINTEVNVVETLLSVATALIGLYIAISIQKKNNRSQSLHNLLQSKMDSFLNNYSVFESNFTSQSTIRLSVATRSIKSLNQEINGLKALFKSFSVNCACIDSIEQSIDDLDELLTGNTPVVNNAIQLSSKKSAILRKSTDITQKIANAYVEINKVL